MKNPIKLLMVATAITLVAACGGGGGGGSNATRVSSILKLEEVKSYQYTIAATTSTPNISSFISNSNVDLVILNWGPNDPILKSSGIDPLGKKLIFSYIDVGETNPWMNPSLFSNGIPSWFGKPNPGFNQLYSVQYWNEAWLTQIKKNIDTIIAQGYDGIFLDVLTADMQWTDGNRLGNTVNPNALQDLVTLLRNIRQYVDSKGLKKKLYLIGNNPINIAFNYPDELKNLDGIFNENIFYSQNPENGAQSIEFDMSTYVSMFAPIYNAINIPIFGNDYPSLNSPAEVLKSFDYYNSFGWIPSINKPLQTADILSSGPIMLMANSIAKEINGEKNIVNYMAGGVQDYVSLTGGDKGDYFIAGTGVNSIKGGIGNDVIYAHPNNFSPLSNVRSLRRDVDGGGGLNTVIFRRNKDQYTLIKLNDGSYSVTSVDDVEGLTSLKNVQIIKFADQQMNLD